MEDAEVQRTEPEVPTEQGEMEPLLGRPGDASQPSGSTMVKNLILGTGIIAELGIFLLVALVWASVFLHPLILFSPHPLLMSLTLLLFVQSALVLQPTHTAEQKHMGQVVHASINTLGFLTMVAGVAVIEYNKGPEKAAHFHSPHAYMGIITSLLILLQFLVGLTMWATPKLYGGEERAKNIWKYHRWSGYTVLTLMLATVVASTKTYYVENVLHIKFWAVLLLAIVTLIGIYPRIQKQKLGLN